MPDKANDCQRIFKQASKAHFLSIHIEHVKLRRTVYIGRAQLAALTERFLFEFRNRPLLLELVRLLLHSLHRLDKF